METQDAIAAGGDVFGELGAYVAEQQRRVEKLAARFGFNPILCDDYAGGRLDQFAIYELLKKGDERGARRLIREAQRLAAIDRDACAEPAADADGGDYMAKRQQRRKERRRVEHKDR
jgi:hypothetical protein